MGPAGRSFWQMWLCHGAFAPDRDLYWVAQASAGELLDLRKHDDIGTHGGVLRGQGAEDGGGADAKLAAMLAQSSTAIRDAIWQRMDGSGGRSGRQAMALSL